jgi:putative ABC transport system substrate-binding protein
MKRRNFLALTGAAAAWPLMARAQQAMPVVGFLRSTTFAASSHFVAAFSQGLKEQGFVEGSNVAIEHRYADNQPDRAPALTADLLRKPVAAICADAIFALAVKAANTSVPVVFSVGADPVKLGLVESLNRPGGHITGINFLTASLAAKRLDLLRQIAPKGTTIGMLVYSSSPETAAERQAVEAAAQSLGQNLIVAAVNSDSEVEPAIAALAQRGAGALLGGPGALLFANRDKIVAQATRLRLPASYPTRDYAVAGGLMAYGTSLADAFRLAGVYVGRILKGEKPADMPVLQASKFEFVINLTTAKALGLEFHPQLLATADEVIE